MLWGAVGIEKAFTGRLRIQPSDKPSGNSVECCHCLSAVTNQGRARNTKFQREKNYLFCFKTNLRLKKKKKRKVIRIQAC